MGSKGIFLVEIVSWLIFGGREWERERESVWMVFCFLRGESLKGEEKRCLFPLKRGKSVVVEQWSGGEEGLSCYLYIYKFERVVIKKMSISEWESIMFGFSFDFLLSFFCLTNERRSGIKKS